MPKVITITPNSSKEGLYERLKQEAAVNGQRMQYFAGRIIDYALNNQQVFDASLKKPLEENGKGFVINLEAESKKRFKAWASEKNRTQSGHAVFILEKYLDELVGLGFSVNNNNHPPIDLAKTGKYWRDVPINDSELPILNIYFDPDLLNKEEISQVLISLNDVYRAMGGKELVILDEQVGEFSYEPKNELV